jgi:hypothetical protein
MRHDDDYRHYTPLLRRIVVIVALLTAVPVALWTITAVVRNYVGQPQLPTFRRVAAAPAVQLPDNAAQPSTFAPNAPDSGNQAGAQQPPAASTDSVSSPPADSQRNVTIVLPSATTEAEAKPVDRFIDRVIPEGMMPTGALAANPPANPSATSDALPADPMPAAEPLRGPIPLPRSRPRIFAMAQVTGSLPAASPAAPADAPRGTPMPRSRPAAAGPSAAATAPASQGPLGFIQNLFQQQ